MVDLVMDAAGAKGTGKWMSQLALDLGVPSTLVTEAVYARSLSAMRNARCGAGKALRGPAGKYRGDRAKFIEQIRQALYASKICSYAQGYVQMQHAAAEYDWPLDFGSIALLWRGGCIIRAVFSSGSRRRSTPSRSWKTCSSHRCHESGEEGRRIVAATWWPRQRSWACPCRPSPPHWPITTATATHSFRPICCRRSAITSAPTPTAPIDQEGIFHSDWLGLRKPPEA